VVEPCTALVSVLFAPTVPLAPVNPRPPAPPVCVTLAVAEWPLAVALVLLATPPAPPV
jgi:hypothetical protein